MGAINKYEQLANESRQKRIYERSCLRKRPFNSIDDAKRLSCGQDVYLCRFCNKWHASATMKKIAAGIKKKIHFVDDGGWDQ